MSKRSKFLVSGALLSLGCADVSMTALLSLLLGNRVKTIIRALYLVRIRRLSNGVWLSHFCLLSN